MVELFRQKLDLASEAGQGFSVVQVFLCQSLNGQPALSDRFPVGGKTHRLANNAKATGTDALAESETRHGQRKVAGPGRQAGGLGKPVQLVPAGGEGPRRLLRAPLAPGATTEAQNPQPGETR